jgi:hypothetical protein
MGERKEERTHTEKRRRRSGRKSSLFSKMRVEMKTEEEHNKN